MAECVPSEVAKWWAVYVRVSSLDQAREGVSLDAQEEKCRLALKLQDDGDAYPVKLYREFGESGKNMDRPEMQRLLADMEGGRAHGVVCFALDRLSRSVADFCSFCALAEKQGVRILCVSQHFDTSSPTGRLIVNVLMSFAQFERESIVSRITTAVRFLRGQGHWTGGCTPFGYDLVRNDGRCALVINEEEAKVMQRMFELVRTTQSLSATAQALWREGVKRPDGRGFDLNMIGRMVQNRTYLGEVAVKDSEKRSGKQVVRWMKGQHDAIVSQEVFDAVAQVTFRRTKHEIGSKKTSRIYILQGILHCSVCNAMFTPSYAYHAKRTVKFTHYYRCGAPQKRTQERACCPFHNINADKIEAEVIQAIADLALDASGLLEEICQNITRGAHPAAAHLETERQSILADQREAQREMENALAFVKKAGADAPRHLLSEIKKLERKLDLLTQDLEENECASAAAAPVRADPDQLRELFGHVGNMLKASEPEQQREILRLLLQRIDVTKDGLVLHMYELAEDSASQKDMGSKTNFEWWRIRGSNP